MKLLPIAAIALLTQSAFAVEYTLPTGAWYQLQDTESYETACEGNGATCDVAPGRYQLINHDLPFTDPDHKRIENVTTGSPNLEEPSEPELPAFYTLYIQNENAQEAGLSCTAGDRAIGSTCNAQNSDGEIIAHGITMNGFPGTSICLANEPVDFLTAQLTCTRLE